MIREKIPVPKGTKLKFITINKDDNRVYLVYETKTERTIQPKKRKKASEVIAIGMSYEKFIEKYGELQE